MNLSIVIDVGSVTEEEANNLLEVTEKLFDLVQSTVPLRTVTLETKEIEDEQ